VKDTRGCPGDAANWDSTAFIPKTGLYYFMALEECTGQPTGYPDQTGAHFLERSIFALARGAETLNSLKHEHCVFRLRFQ
jgi:hypothetical protein